MILETRHLELMAAVAEHGTLTRASKELHLTQSALSHQLLNLETRLRTPMFSRVGRRMVPTAAGLRLLAAARSALPHLRTAEEDLRRLVDGRAGTVRVSTECYTCYHWLPGVLKRVARTVPGIEVQIVAEATRSPIAALSEGRIDLAITSTPGEAALEIHPLFTDELVAVMSPRHPLATRPYLVPADFTAEHLILYTVPRSELTVFNEFLGPAGVEPARVSHMQLTEAILEMVRADLGIGVLARWVAAPAVERGSLVTVPLGKRGLLREWSAVLLPSERHPPHLLAFLRALREEPAWRVPSAKVALGVPQVRNGTAAGTTARYRGVKPRLGTIA
jgi:LysR family transcriptional regulator, regulator for metE and metH